MRLIALTTKRVTYIFKQYGKRRGFGAIFAPHKLAT